MRFIKIGNTFICLMISYYWHQECKFHHIRNDIFRHVFRANYIFYSVNKSISGVLVWIIDWFLETPFVDIPIFLSRFQHKQMKNHMFSFHSFWELCQYKQILSHWLCGGCINMPDWTNWQANGERKYPICTWRWFSFAVPSITVHSWWRYQLETFFALLALCGNSPVTGEFPSQSLWRGALMFSLICAWTNGWVNNW